MKSFYNIIYGKLFCYFYNNYHKSRIYYDFLLINNVIFLTLTVQCIEIKI